MAMRIGYAAGAFDLFHVGHLNLLRQARSRCDFLIAGVVSDQLLIARKGRTPVIPLCERLEIVRNVGFVDEAIAETLASKVDMWRQTTFDVLFKGDDWKGTAKGLELEQEFAPLGVEIIYFPYTVHTSSTILRRTLELLERESEEAKKIHRLVR
ncbi:MULTISPECIES: adenylyltransferase/cytidyltransferase family protein [Arthrobacter]|uniref:Cytidyltransferase n=1 Tax=Arthrobacter psychrochitiniphilus TaxID=291045 RepID=A0A2V3DVK2_9MICC|nr:MULTISPECIES: adenylyltransferase/cytidyltransferase family protein [Arthrobacter]NYG16558.1 glycerol-3-phosphate cytidylyltransferase [Arthrobacter psychrochitiniphilus]PXA69319.1 cytidyltransferase [Arthrobacter psychrochitiniphilus]